MPDFAIRPFQPSDGVPLADLHRRAILAISDDFYSLAERESWAQGLSADGYGRSAANGEIFEIALGPDGTPVAFCGRKGDEVCGLYVDPDFHGRGIGKLLLARAETAITAVGHGRVTLSASLSAVSFYLARGYHEAERTGFTSRGGLFIQAARLEKVIV